MKKFFASALFIFIYTALWSQITITSSDLPSANDTARYSTSNTRLNFDTTGPVMTWDYSSLVTTGQGVDSFPSILFVDPLYVVLFGFTDIAARTTNLSNLGPLSLTNTYNFIKKTSSYYEINGFAGSYNGVPIPKAYTTPDKLYQFPMNYGRNDTTTYDLSLTIPSLGGIHEVGTRYNNVDGWGMIITPYNAFFCLRLSSRTQQVDSFTITALNLTIPFPQNSLTYQWLANGEKIPVLEVTGTKIGNTFIPSSEKFKDGVRAIPPQFSIRANFRANKTTCTTLDTITITNRTRPNVTGSSYKYTITPSTYNYVRGTNDTVASPQVNFTAPGLYTVELHVESPAGGSTPAVGDTTRTDYITVTFPAGIQNISVASDMQVYPNPVSDILMVRSSEMISTAVMINTSGQKVMEQAINSTTADIAVKEYPQGVYLLDIQTATGHQVRKIVIQ